jgi:hypothetical protein
VPYLRRRIAHEADGTIVGSGNASEPLVTGVSGPWPAARWEAHDKIGSATNSASYAPSAEQAATELKIDGRLSVFVVEPEIIDGQKKSRAITLMRISDAKIINH